MKNNIRDIIRERLEKQSLSVSPESTMRELDNALIPWHEKNLAKAEKDMEKASADGDAAAHDAAFNEKIKELGILIKLYEKKQRLLSQILSNERDKKIKSIKY